MKIHKKVSITLNYAILRLTDSRWLKGHTLKGYPKWTPSSRRAALMSKKDAMKIERGNRWNRRAVEMPY